MKKAASIAVSLLLSGAGACSPQGDEPVSPLCDATSCVDATLADASDEATIFADAADETTTCSALDAAEAGPEADPLFPAARYRVSSASSIGVSTVCLQTSEATYDTTFAVRALRASGITLATGSDCERCDACISFDSDLDPFAGASGTAKETLRAAGDNAERHAVTSTITTTSGLAHASVKLHAYGDHGARYALAAALSLFTSSSGALRVSEGTIVDYPSFPVRGIVEGIYGPSGATALHAPWTVSDRIAAIRLAARLRENAYVYGPKDDRYARGNWRTPYPLDGDGLGQAIQTAAAEALQDGIDFTWSLSPCDGGPRFDFSNYEADRAVALAKLESVRTLGVRRFALFLDDTSSCGTAEEHARLIDDLDDWSKKTVGQPILFVGRHYWGGPDAYTDTLGRLASADVPIFWTGNAIEPPTMTASDMNAIEASLGRPVAIWDNWPTTPCGFHGRSADLPSKVSLFFSNPVLNEGSSAELPFEAFTDVLGPIADYLWDADRYAASSTSEDASFSRFQALHVADAIRGEACKPCGGAAASFHCVNESDIGYCDPRTACFTVVSCGGGCREGTPAQCLP